jgi:hypothetical protein
MNARQANIYIIGFLQAAFVCWTGREWYRNFLSQSHVSFLARQSGFLAASLLLVCRMQQ